MLTLGKRNPTKIVHFERNFLAMTFSRLAPKFSWVIFHPQRRDKFRQPGNPVEKPVLARKPSFLHSIDVAPIAPYNEKNQVFGRNQARAAGPEIHYQPA
jgi:hypothetical protein